MSQLKDKRVLIFQQRGWGVRMGYFLSQRLHAEGCKLTALTFKKSTHNFIVKQKDVSYDLIINHDEILGNPKKYLGDDTYSIAEICESLGVDSIWPIMASSRRHTRSYKDKYYYSFKKNVSDDAMIDYVKAAYKCVKTIFDKFNPELILAPNFPDVIHIIFNLYAKKRGVTMIGVADTKVKGLTIFVHDYNMSSGAFYERVDELNSGAKSDSAAKAKQYIAEFREQFKTPAYFESIMKKKNLYRRIRHQLSPYREIARWFIQRPLNALPNLGITLDYRTPRIILRDHYARHRYLRAANKFKYFPFEKIGKYVYFPLQVQPEATIDVQAPFFNNQIEIARLVAQSLPEDYTLVVKEHPVMADKRPPSYLKKIAGLPNVKFIDYRTPNSKVLQNCAMIVSPNSTTITEGALYNKPSVQLGNLGTTQKLPGVVKHTDLTTLSQVIKKSLAMDTKSDEYEKVLENYVAAAYDTGFDFNYWGVWDRAEKGNMDELWQIYKDEIERVLV